MNNTLSLLPAVCVMAALAGAIPAHADGTVNFANDSSCKVINGSTLNPVTSAQNIKAALYWAPTNSSSFTQIGTSIGVGTPLDGIFAGGTRITGPATPGGHVAQFQVRAWGGGSATYEAALLIPGTLLGTSAVLQIPTGNPAGDPPTPAASLVAAGLLSFTLNATVNPPLNLTCASNATAMCGSVWNFTEPTTSGGCAAITVTVVNTITNGVCPQLITRTWQATDGCTTNTCSQTVTNVDVTPPVINCAGNKSVECGVPWDFDAPTATDECSLSSLTLLNTTTNAGCGNTFTATRTWLAADACGNSNICSQIVTVVDTTAPEVICPSNQVVECGLPWTFDAPTATDACGNNSISVTSTVTNAGCGNTFTATQSWLVADACGNTNQCSQTVTVVDTTAPEVICPSNQVVECGLPWTFDAPTATDACGTNSISVTSTVTNGACGNTFTALRSWLATDACGNSVACTQTVAIVDTTPPAVACGANKSVLCGAEWTFDPPTVDDSCDGTNANIAVVSTLTNTLCPLIVTRTWSATDACGNSNACSQTVTVTPAAPPTLACATNKIVSCTNEWSFDAPEALNECGGTNVTVEVIGTVTNSLCPLSLTRTWRATNDCNPVGVTCSQTVTVLCPSCPVLLLTKSCPPYPVPPGGTLAWTGTITNASDITISNVVVVNDQPTPNSPVFGPVTLSPGEGASFAGSYSVSACSCGPHVDTLAASGIGLEGILFTGSATASCAGTNHITPGDMNGDGIVDQGELNAVLANYWPHSPWISMTNAALLCDGKFQFELTNNSAWNFTVLVTTNLVDWTNLPGPAYPVYQFTDPEGTNAPQRIYRLQWP